MANYSRETMEDYGTAGTLLLGLVGLAGAAFIGGAVSKQDKRSQINNQISALDSDIISLSSGFLGAFLNSDQIESKKREKAELRKQLESL